MSEGDIYFLDYGEQGSIYHARLLAAHIQGHLWVVVTPDEDIYEELLHESNRDLVAIYRGNGGLGAAVPAELDPNRIYGFRPLTAIRYQELMTEAREYAASLRVQFGLPPPGLGAVAAAAGLTPEAAAAPLDLVWVAVEDDCGYMRGDVVVDIGETMPQGSLTLGTNKALIQKDSGVICAKLIARSKIHTMEVQDLRVLPLTLDEQKSRKIDFSKDVGKMKQVDMPGGGLQLDGPPSSLSVLRGMVSRGLTVTDHEHWVRTHDALKGDRSIYEMEVITRAIEAFCMVDQVNVPNLKGCELLLRRWQLIREAHRLSPGSPDYSSADIFMGWEYRRGEGVNPALAKFVAGELRDQAQIAKESRKAREEMASRKKPGGRGQPAASDK